jgi:hypothetical protein
VLFAPARLQLFRFLAESREREFRRQAVVRWWVGLLLVPGIPAVIALLFASPFRADGPWNWLFASVMVACVTYPLAALAIAAKWRPPFIDCGPVPGDAAAIVVLINLPALTFLLGDVLAFIMRCIGPGMFLEAWRDRRILRRLPQVDYDRLALAMAQLYANDQGRIYAELTQPGESFEDVVRVVWYLNDCSWVDVNLRQANVSLRDAARKRLNKATGNAAL